LALNITSSLADAVFWIGSLREDGLLWLATSGLLHSGHGEMENMRAIEQTLLEQMRIDKIEIARRQEMLGFSQKDADLLAWCKPLIKDGIDSLVADFYERLTAIEEVALIIGDSDTLIRMQRTMEKYVEDLFDGCYDSEYANNRLRIGLIHTRIGVAPQLYLVGVRHLEELLQSLIRERITDSDMQARLIDSLGKLFSFDMAFVFDAYIRSLVMQVEHGKERLEAFARSLENEIAERTSRSKALSHQDGLTGLNNRRALREVLRRDLPEAERSESTLSVVCFDVDHLKEISDSIGRERGDELLVAVAHALRAVSRHADVLCRVGSDEFCVVLRGCDSEQAEKYCERLLTKLKEKEPEAELSFGIAQSGPNHCDEPDALVSRAGDLLSRAKKTDGSHIVR
jgi:diguanylate cyclase (GGDEF)-like protein